MATAMAIEKVTKVVKNRAKVTVINMAVKKISRRSHCLPAITDGPSTTKTLLIEGTKKDTSMVIMEIGIRV
jgi:folate-dependent tRNA-U54 methylase TrmFO/GidA